MLRKPTAHQTYPFTVMKGGYCTARIGPRFIRCVEVHHHGLRHRHVAKAAGTPLLPGPTTTAPALDPTRRQETGRSTSGGSTRRLLLGVRRRAPPVIPGG